MDVGGGNDCRHLLHQRPQCVVLGFICCRCHVTDRKAIFGQTIRFSGQSSRVSFVSCFGCC